MHPDASRVAKFMESIPPQDKNAASVDSLSETAGLTTQAVSALVALLDTSGSLTIVSDSATGVSSIRSANATASFFLKSLAQYVRTGKHVLVNWERPGTVVGPYSSNEALSGPQFLYLMERQRLASNPNSTPLRKAQIAQVLIKCRIRGRGKTLYLTQYDSASRQFQLLGGHKRENDSDLHETAVRELEEELTNFSFDPAHDSLVELGQVQIVQLSRTYGVATQYDIKIFEFRSDRRQLSTSPGARWLTEDELIRSQSDDLNLIALRKVAERIPGGVANLAFSLKFKQNKPWREIIDENSWAFWGILVGILGVALTIIFFFLS